MVVKEFKWWKILLIATLLTHGDNKTQLELKERDSNGRAYQSKVEMFGGPTEGSLGWCCYKTKARAGVG